MSAGTSLTLSILRNPPSLLTARVSGSTTTPVGWQEFPAGDSIKIQFQITDGAGAYETLTSRTYRVGIGNLNAPCTGGTFTVSDYLGATTAALPYNISASGLQFALNSLNGNTGPGGALVTVIGVHGEPFTIIYRTNGTRNLLTFNVANLEPSAVAIVAETQTGSGSLPEIQMARLVQMPYALQSSWTIASTTASAVLSLSSPGLYQWLAKNPFGQTYFEIEETDGTNIRKICQAPVVVSGDSIPYTTLGTQTMNTPAQQSVIVWQPYVTLLTGGVSTPQITSLNLIPTVSLPVLLTAVIFYNATADETQIWQLISSTHATGTGWQRPADYDGSTNQKVWKELQ